MDCIHFFVDLACLVLAFDFGPCFRVVPPNCGLTRIYACTKFLETLKKDLVVTYVIAHLVSSQYVAGKLNWVQIGIEKLYTSEG